MRTHPLCVSTCLLAIVVLALAGCRHESDEAQVRASITAMATAAQAAAVGDVVEPLSDDFDGNGGELDRHGIANLVRLFALRGEHIGVLLGPVGIEHRGERLLATVTVTLSGGGRLLPEHAGVYRVQSAWRREGSAWRCYTASWKRVL